MPSSAAIRFCALGLLLLWSMGCAFDLADAGVVRAKVPITTDSAAAQRLFEEGRDLLEKVLPGDAHRLFAEAAARDESFALAHLMMAETAADADSRKAALDRAVALVDGVSDGERAMILGHQAGWRGDAEGQLAHYQQLVALFPEDERALALIGNFHFERQEHPLAITYFKRATAVDPEFSQAYNQMGYSYRSIGRWKEAEQAFLRYIELMPEEANPYDSYAELLMQMGRFEDSVTQYREALARNSEFLPSLVGVGKNQLFLGDPVGARETFEKLSSFSRTDRERGTAVIWTAVTYLHEGLVEEAVARLEDLSLHAEQANLVAEALSYRLLQSSIWLENGNLESARQILDQVAEAESRETDGSRPKGGFGLEPRVLYLQTRLALARQQPALAEEILQELEKVAETMSRRQRLQELEARLSLALGEPARALENLAGASQQDPQIVWLQALACRQIGDSAGMSNFARRVARAHEFSSNLSYAIELALLKPKVEALLASA